MTGESGQIATDWATADRISDRIVDVVNEELGVMRKAGDIQPFQLIAGQLLAFCALFNTVPILPPPPMEDLDQAVRKCLSWLVSVGPNP